MSGLYMSHRKFAITPKDNYQDQWTLTRSMWTNKSTIKNTRIKTNTKNDSTLKYDVRQKWNQRSNLWIKLSTFNRFIIEIEKSWNDNNKPKRLVKSTKQWSKRVIQ